MTGYAKICYNVIMRQTTSVRIDSELAKELKYISLLQNRRCIDVLGAAVRLYLRVRYPAITIEGGLHGRVDTTRGISSTKSQGV